MNCIYPESITESLILTSVTITAITNRLIISSTFYQNTAQGLVIIYHQCIENNKNLTVSSVHVSLNHQNQTVMSIDVDAGCYHVAVFGITAEYSSEEPPASVVCVRVPGQSKINYMQ